MKKRLLALFLSIIILLTGCTSALEKDTSEVTDSQIVPDWLFAIISAEFKTTELIKPEEITFMEVRMKETDEPQILAYVTLDRLNGVVMLFEHNGNCYKTVYKKNEPVYGIQIFGSNNNQLVSFISGYGGTGMQENIFYILGYSSEGYKELWEGIAEKFTFGGQPPYFHSIGAINFDMSRNSMIYTQYTRIFNRTDYNVDMPDRIETRNFNYKYNPDACELMLMDSR